MAAVVTASKNMVCVVGHAGTGAKNAWDTTHGMREVKKGAEKIKMCKIYTGIVCTDHVEIFTKLAKNANELLQPMGTRELDALEASGTARVDAAIQTLGSNEAEGKKELKKVADEYGPLPCSKKAAEVLRLMAEKGR